VEEDDDLMQLVKDHGPQVTARLLLLPLPLTLPPRMPLPLTSASAPGPTVVVRDR